MKLGIAILLAETTCRCGWLLRLRDVVYTAEHGPRCVVLCVECVAPLLNELHTIAQLNDPDRERAALAFRARELSALDTPNTAGS